MQIKVLIENDTCSPVYQMEHGLSLYIKTQEHTILFDMGKSDLFLKNAAVMDVDIKAVDIAILSHGHYDHGGGLPSFMEANDTATIYFHRCAGERHFARRADGGIDEIGIDPSFMNQPRVLQNNADFQIDKNLLLFSTVSGQRFCSSSNRVLLTKDGNGWKQDDFIHEQNLLIFEQGKKVLITGCAHRGIINILDRAMELAGGPMDLVIGGFHLSNPKDGICEPMETIENIAEVLMSYPTIYYTGHCTGKTAYNHLKNRMKDRIHPIQSGTELTFWSTTP